MFEAFSFEEKAASNMEPVHKPPDLPDSVRLSLSLSPTALPATAALPEPKVEDLPPLEPVEHLAHELSKQSLISSLEPPSVEMGSRELNSESLPLLPEPTIESADLASPDEILARHFKMPPPLDLTPLEAMLPTDGIIAPDVKRLRRQSDSRFHNDPANARVIRRLETMIATGSQCNIYSSMPPTPNSARSSFVGSLAESSVAEFDVLMMDVIDPLEVDPAYSEKDVADIDDLLKEAKSYRKAYMGDRGVRKYFRNATEAAFQCRNLKRSRPKMRRRPGTSKPASPMPTPALLA